MDYIEGESLTSLLQREGALSPRRAASILSQCCDALQAAHDLDIVHRDLKPDNIMIEKARDGSDFVKIVELVRSAPGHGVGDAGCGTHAGDEDDVLSPCLGVIVPLILLSGDIQAADPRLDARLGDSEVILPGQAIEDQVKALESPDQMIVIVGVHLHYAEAGIVDAGCERLRRGYVVVADHDLVEIRKLDQVTGGVLADGACTSKG